MWLLPTMREAKGRELWKRSLSMRAIWPERMMGTGVEVGLSDSVKLIEDIEPEEMSFVDDKDRNLLGGDDVG
jgi:hypothetical protein